MNRGASWDTIRSSSAWRINESLYGYFQQNQSHDDHHWWGDDLTAVSIKFDDVSLAMMTKKSGKKCAAHSEFFFFCFFSCFCHHSGSADLASSVTTQNNSIRNNFGKDTTGLTHTETHLWSCFILQLYYTWLYILSSDLYVGEQTETWQTNHKHCRVWLLFPEPAYHHL